MRRMIFSKRTLAMLLALMMTLSVVYVPAFAVGAEPQDNDAPATHVCDFSGEPCVVAPDHVNGKAGYTYFECQIEGCDKVHILENSIVDAGEGEHVWEDVAAVAPTCTAAGNIAYKVCKAPNCDAVADENGNVVEGGADAFTVPALGHKFTEWTVTTDYLCTDLETSRYCLSCEYTESVDWHEDYHNYQPVFDDTYVKPLCNMPGQVTFKCVSEHASGIKCSAVMENVTIKATRQHITYVVEAVAPTCTETGMGEYHVCTMCGNNFDHADAYGNEGRIASLESLKVNAKGHDIDMSDFVRIEGMGCGVENNMISECKNGCGHAVYATEEHNWGEPVRLPGLACGAENNMKVECTLCEEVKYETQNHNYIETSKTETVAYCEKTVVLVETCEYCFDVVTTKTTSVCHNEVVVDAVAATCVSNGLTEGKKCGDCGQVLVEQETVYAADVNAAHKAAGYHQAAQDYVFPTCTTVGYTNGTKCTECGLVVEEPKQIPATGHTYNTEEIPATCQKEGYRVGGVCLNDDCGYVVPGKTIAIVPCAPKAEKTLVSAATCNSYAVYDSECKWCDAVLENFVDEESGYDADNHDGACYLDVASSKAANCVDDGYAYYVCANCDFAIKIIANDADKEDAAEDGCTVMTENEFKAEYPDVLTFTVTATGHDFSVLAVDQAPTCTEAGLKVWYCQNDDCDEEKRETPAATGHSNDGAGVYTVIDEATCYETGLAKYICATCQTQIGDDVVLDKIDHTPGEVKVENNEAPTCTVPGSYENVVYCTVEGCGAQISRDKVEVSATGHGEYNVFVSTTATCTNAGVETYECANGCGDTKTVNVEHYGHTEGEVKVENNKAPTCTTAGSYDNVIYCSREGCGIQLSRETITVNALGHTPDEAVQESVVPATCLNAGSYESVVYCANENCDHEISRTEVAVDPLGHTAIEDSEYRVTTEPTCTGTGLGEYFCNNEGCDVKVGEKEIPANGHTPGEIKVENNEAPTCTVPGSYENVVYCTVEGCGAQISRDKVEVPATGHSHDGAGVYTVIDAPTCLEEGLARYICETCQTQIGEDIVLDALGHTYDGYKSVVTLGTCENGAGVYVKNCSVCDDETAEDDSETVVFDTTKCDHGTLQLVNGELVYVTVYGANKNQTIEGVWTYVPVVHNVCQEGTVGGYICGTCGAHDVIDPNYEGQEVGSKIPASHDCEPVEHKATCLVEGYIEMKCDCGYSYVIDDSYHVADKNDKSVHTNLGGYQIKVQASCDNVNGIFVQTCADCGMTFETKVTYDLTEGHGYIVDFVDGAPVYSIVPVVDVEHISNKCQEGTVGGEYCSICDYVKHDLAEYADKAIGSKIKPVHNLRADAQTPSCEGLGIQGWTYHEYCVDCDYGNNPARDGWEILECTKCVEVTVAYKAPTCTEAGNSEYTYRACCATKAQIAAMAEAAVIPATNHEGTVVTLQTAAPTCTTPSFTYTVCEACNSVETFTLVSYIAPLGHNVVSMNNGVDASCMVDGKEADKICDRCKDESTFVEGAVISAAGHTNAAGEHFFDTDACAADILENDRFCVDCDKYIDFTHRYATQITNANCQTGEIHINTCVRCNTQKAMEVVRGPWTEEEHREYILSQTPEVTPATPTEYGKEVYTCNHCGETIVINVPLAGGIEFELDYNVVYPTYDADGNITGFVKSDRKETTNGSWIAVDVLVYSNEDFHFSQIDISFSFNRNVKYFGPATTTGVNNFVVENVVNNNSVVTIAAGMDPNADTPYTFVDTVGEGAEGVVLATVYFQVASYKGVGAAEFSFEGNAGVYLANDNGFDVLTKYASFDSDALTFTSKVLGDYYVDNAINGVELLMIKQMINGQIVDAEDNVVTYDVTLDLNKDGAVTAIDYEILKALVNFNDTFSNSAYMEVAGR